ncbi:MAG: hypothetical protein RID53_29330 [Coleofasciculus sp. B1-GNL1-01]|uniref:hypothetical protein n=1 Tax=Coleofasciculus sp. B1-GNL1-01 TaxID=3068484 RepID=UPI0032F52758
MIGRLVVTSGLVVAGVVAFSPNVLAQSVDVPFEANVGERCSFATPVPGTLVYEPGQPFITSDAPGGISGTVEVSCNTTADLEITDARFVSFTPADPNAPPITSFPSQQLDAIATVAGSFNPSTATYSGPSEGGGFPGGSLLLDPINQTVEVDLAVDSGVPLAGIYQYTVTLTIVP